jgi:hypothetical protein
MATDTEPALQVSPSGPKGEGGAVEAWRIGLQWWIVGAMALGLTGCSGSRSDQPRVYATKGQVFVGGQPAVNARVQLQAVDSPTLRPLCPHAIVGADGTYQLTTFRSNDGAPAGTYALTLTWPSPPKPGHDEDGPDRFRGRYADPQRPLRQVEIKPSANDLGRIDLK